MLQSTIQNRKFKIGLAAAWTLLILAACSIPGRDIPDVPVFQFDKVVHFGMFAVFAWLWMAAGVRRRRRRALMVFLAGVGYGIFTEVYQGLLPFERSPDPYDMIADALGTLAAVILYIHLRVRKRAP